MHQFYASSNVCRTNWVKYAAWVSFCHINYVVSEVIGFIVGICYWMPPYLMLVTGLLLPRPQHNTVMLR